MRLSITQDIVVMRNQRCVVYKGIQLLGPDQGPPVIMAFKGWTLSIQQAISLSEENMKVADEVAADVNQL